MGIIFSNMKIGKKLIISFIVVTIISSIATVFGIIQLINADKKYSNALVYYGFSQGDVGNFLSSINKGRSILKDFVILDDLQVLKNKQAELDEVTKDTDQYLQAVKSTLSDVPKEQEFYKVIEENIPIYREKRNEVVQLGINGRDTEALRVFNDVVQPCYDKIETAAQNLMALYKETGSQLSTDLTSQSHISLTLVVCVMIGAIIISILFSLAIARAIARPMQECSKRLVSLSKGDLKSVVPDIKNKDETGVLANATKELVENLKAVIDDLTYVLGEMASGNLKAVSSASYEGDFIPLQKSTHNIITAFNNTLGQINEAADQVSSNSEQVSIGAQALSQGTTEQASSIQELAATINDISRQVNDNADNAHNASEKAEIVGKEMAESNQKMQDMIQAINEISSSSQEIGKIIKTIEDIAFQTNILALNAAVEAARAGAAGKGFAVVADEVRNLASKSAEASKSTAALIETSIQSVVNGTKIADETAHSLLEAVEGAKNVIQTIDLISKASGEQAVSISQVTLGMDQISSVIQTNSATAEESAAASEELSGQAQTLKSLVNRFKLKEDNLRQEESIFTENDKMELSVKPMSYDKY